MSLLLKVHSNQPFAPYTIMPLRALPWTREGCYCTYLAIREVFCKYY